MFNRVVIVGVGLIGGSLGLEIKRKKIAQEVIGVGRSQSNLKIALKRKLIDRATTDLSKAVSNADLILLCTPVKSALHQLTIIARHAKPGTWIMDVGSTKEEIVKEAARIFLPRSLFFIGAHPMAGTEKSGAVGAEKDLFRGKICILTSSPNLSQKAKNQAVGFWKKMGSRVVWSSPSQHDKNVAVTSHLPQLISSALMTTVTKLVSKKDLKTFSGSGLKGMVRLASSPANMWVDICLSNSKNIKKSLEYYIEELSNINKWIKFKKRGSLKKYFERVSKSRL